VLEKTFFAKFQQKYSKNAKKFKKSEKSEN